MPPVPTEPPLPDLRRPLLKAMLKLWARRGKKVTYDALAKELGLSERQDLFRAARGAHGFGARSKRRKKVEGFIEEMLK